MRKSLFTSLCTMRSVVAAILLTVASTQGHAKDSRVHLTFVKAAAKSGGTGALFYELQRYGLRAEGIDPGAIHSKRIDLIGTASNLQSAADIVGSYTAADAADASVGRGTTARLENAKGVVLEIRSVNLDRALNLNDLTLKNSGWQTHSE